MLAFIGASVVARVAARAGYRRILFAAFGLMAAGSAGLMASYAVLPLFALSSAVTGFGMGLALGGLPTVIVEGSAEDRTASATAVYNNLKTLGGSVAGAGASVVLGTMVVGGTEVPALSAYLTIWGLSTLVCVLALLLQTTAFRQAGSGADGSGADDGEGTASGAGARTASGAR